MLPVVAIKDTAMGGIVCIDEAYSLAQGGERDFGKDDYITLEQVIEEYDNMERVV